MSCFLRPKNLLHVVGQVFSLQFLDDTFCCKASLDADLIRLNLALEPNQFNQDFPKDTITFHIGLDWFGRAFSILILFIKLHVTHQSSVAIDSSRWSLSARQPSTPSCQLADFAVRSHEAAVCQKARRLTATTVWEEGRGTSSGNLSTAQSPRVIFPIITCVIIPWCKTCLWNCNLWVTQLPQDCIEAILLHFSVLFLNVKGATTPFWSAVGKDSNLLDPINRVETGRSKQTQNPSNYFILHSSGGFKRLF